MRAFVISLREDEGRRAFMREQLERLEIPFEFFDAVRGSERIGDPSWYDDALARRLEGRSLRAGEVGCALSHAAVYAEVARRGLPWALVLEDDAVLHPDLPLILGQLEGGILRDGEVVSLSRCDHYLPWSRRPVAGRYGIVRPILVREGSTAQTAGYVVTRQAAAAMALANKPVRFPADSWGYYRGLVAFRGIVPTLTLVTQRTELGSTTTADGARAEFKPYSLKDLLWHGFKTYNPLGRALKNAAKRLLSAMRRSDHGR